LTSTWTGFYCDIPSHELPRNFGEYLAGTFAAVLRGDHQPLPSEIQARITDALVVADTSTNQHVVECFVAISLGGAQPGDPAATGRFVELIASDDPEVCEAAGMNLGFVASPQEILSMTGIVVGNGPADEDDVRFYAGFLLGLHNAFWRHPEDAHLVLPIFEEVLLNWYHTPLQDEVRQHLLRFLSTNPVESLRPVYEILSEEKTFERTSVWANRALQKIAETENVRDR
jgi:hypothetical protein